MNNRPKKISLILLILFSLTACVPALFGITAGGMLLYDKRSPSIIFQDINIAYQIELKIKKDNDLNQNGRVIVEAMNGNVLLAGQVPKHSDRTKIEEIALATPNVRHIYNEISVTALPRLIARANDKLITSKVRLKMIETRGLKSGSFKIVTVNHIVYLIGQVTYPQGQLASAVARRIKGVKRVILLFEYKKVRK